MASATPQTRLGFIGLSAGAGGYGAGSWASISHLPYLKSARNKSYTITGIQNSSKESAQKAATTYELGDKISYYNNPNDLATDPQVDVVVVSVKVPNHYDAVMPALKAGKDIFVEWPLARTLQDAEEMAALAREKNLRTLVGLQARQNPSIIAAKKLVDAGEAGDIVSTTMHGFGVILGAISPADFAYSHPIENGANLITIAHGHAIDALCWILGEWDYVSATLANRRPKFALGDDKGNVVGEGTKTSHDFVALTGTLTKSGGAVNVVYEGGMNPSGGPGFFWQINGTKGTIVLEGEMGQVQMFQPKIKFGKLGEELKEVEGVKWVGQDFSHAVGEAWNAFAGHGDGCVTGFEEALVRHRMIEAIYRSNETGKRETYI